jgi:hypothetical protein
MERDHCTYIMKISSKICDSLCCVLKDVVQQKRNHYVCVHRIRSYVLSRVASVCITTIPGVSGQYSGQYTIVTSKNVNCTQL